MSSKKEEKPALMFFQRQINYREKKKREAKKGDLAKKELRKTRDRLRYITRLMSKLMAEIEEIKADLNRRLTKKKKTRLRLKLDTLSCKLKELKNEEYYLLQTTNASNE